MPMEADRIDRNESSRFSKRLSSLYANYADAWRVALRMPDTSAPTAPKEQREQRWEGEGGSVKKDA